MTTPNQDPIEGLLTHVEWVDRHPEIKLTATLVHAKSAIPAIRALQARCKELERDIVSVPSQHELEIQLLEAKLARVIEAGNAMAEQIHWPTEQESDERRLQSWRKAIAE